MQFSIGDIQFRRNPDRAASWRVSINGLFFANVSTQAVARALRDSRNKCPHEAGPCRAN